MDLVSILRTLGGLGTVLGILSAALWLVRRYDIRLPGRTGMRRVSRLELVERLPLDARRSVALLRRDGREHLILLAPEGHLIIENAVVRDAVDVAALEAAAEAVPREIPQVRAEIAAAGENFGKMVDKARERGVPFGRALRNLIGRAAAAIAAARAVAPPPPPASELAVPRRFAPGLIEHARDRATRLGRAIRDSLERTAAVAAAMRARAKGPPIPRWSDVSRRSITPLLEFARARAARLAEQTHDRATRLDRARRRSLERSAAFAAAVRARAKGPPIPPLSDIPRISIRLVADSMRAGAARLGRAFDGLVDQVAALAAPPAFAALGPPSFHEPPIPRRTSPKYTGSRKPARKAQAARKGLRHA